MASRPRVENLNPAQRVLHNRAERLAEVARTDHADAVPITIETLGDPQVGDGMLFECEECDLEVPENRHNQPIKGHGRVIYRTANSWALVKNSTNHMVIPECVLPGERDNFVYNMIAFIFPMSAGARQASRAAAGYTPLYADQSHGDLWQMEVKLLRVKVKTPRASYFEIYGCQIPCTIFPSATNPQIEYAAQNPDPNYMPFFEAFFARWVLPAQRGQVDPLARWEDVNLKEKRVWWMNNWTAK
ncbi:hypothetical protein FRC09_003966, partial [Ceratobasidium sp. 395]